MSEVLNVQPGRPAIRANPEDRPRTKRDVLFAGDHTIAPHPPKYECCLAYYLVQVGSS